MSPNHPPRGFIALISVLLLSFVFLVAIFSLGQFGIFGRFLLLDIENKLRSEEYAEACVHIARILVVNDSETERENVLVEDGDLACTIESLRYDEDEGESTIKAKATSGGAVTNFVVKIDSTDYGILSWEEYSQMP